MQSPFVPISPCLAVLIAALLQAAGPRSLADLKHAEDDYAEIAEKWTAYLATESDQQALYGTKFVDAFLSVGRIEDALRIARSLKGYKHACALYKAAQAAAVDGKKELSQRIFEEASAAPAAWRDFELQEITAARVEALAAQGKAGEARLAVLEVASDAVRKHTESLLFAYDSVEAVEKNARGFCERADVGPGLKGRALLAAAKAFAKSGDYDKAMTTAAESAEMLCKVADVETIPLLRDCVGLIASIGRAEDATRWAVVCAGFARRIDPRAQWKSRDVRLAAEALRAAGKTDEAHALLRELPNLTTSLAAVDYSAGGMEAAAGFLLLDEPEKYHAAAVHVLNHLRTHPHFRARAMAAIEVVAGYIRSRQEMPEPVRQALASTAASIDSDSHFQNPI